MFLKKLNFDFLLFAHNKKHATKHTDGMYKGKTNLLANVSVTFSLVLSEKEQVLFKNLLFVKMQLNKLKVDVS